MISVIIPTHQRHHQLLRLLASLNHQQSPPQHEVIVVSNLRDDALTEQLRGLPCRYLVAERIGVNYARNLGRKHATGDILVYLDDDCVVQNPDYLQRVLRLHQQFPETAAIGGRYLIPPQTTMVERAYHLNTDHWFTRSLYQGNRTINLAGGNVSYKASAFDQMHGFNDRIIFGGAETELHFRMLQAGLKLQLSDEISIEHHLEMNWRDFIRKAFKQGQSFTQRRRANVIVPADLRREVEKNGLSYLPKLSSWPEKFMIRLFQVVFTLGMWRG